MLIFRVIESFFQSFFLLLRQTPLFVCIISHWEWRRNSRQQWLAVPISAKVDVDLMEHYQRTSFQFTCFCFHWLGIWHLLLRCESVAFVSYKSEKKHVVRCTSSQPMLCIQSCDIVLTACQYACFLTVGDSLSVHKTRASKVTYSLRHSLGDIEECRQLALKITLFNWTSLLGPRCLESWFHLSIFDPIP